MNYYRQTEGPIRGRPSATGYPVSPMAPPPSISTPTGPSGAPTGDAPYADYFQYANAGPDTGSAWLAGTPAESGWTGGTNIGEGQVVGQTWKGYDYKEPANIPDKYKGLLKYNEMGTSTGGPNAQSGFQMNKDVIAKLPKTKFGTVDNVTSLGKDGKGTGGPAMHLINPNLKYYDQNFGWITPKNNIVEDRHFTDTFADTIMPMVASAAFGGIGMPSWATGLASGAQSLGNGGDWKSALMNLAASGVGASISGGGLNLPPELAQALKYARYGKTAYDIYNRTR